MIDFAVLFSQPGEKATVKDQRVTSKMPTGEAQAGVADTWRRARSEAALAGDGRHAAVGEGLGRGAGYAGGCGGTLTPGTPSLSDAVAIVAECRKLFGKRAAQALWYEMGLPRPPSSGSSVEPNARLLAEVTDFAAGALSAGRGTTAASRVWLLYLDWCASRDLQPATRKAFGSALTALGAVRTTRGGRVYYRGLRLVDRAPELPLVEEG